MQHKTTELAPKPGGHPAALKVAGGRSRERNSRERLAADLRSIVLAAHKLPAEVAPPARAWRSLRVRLEKEGILSHSVKGRLEEHTRFPMFRS